jgi:hypothetical protein
LRQSDLTMENLIDRLETRSVFLSNLPDPDKYQSSSLANDNTLARMSRALHAVTWISQKQCWFLLDDYSVTVLSPFVQRAYNPVVFRLSSEVRVKVSSEGEGPLLLDTFQRKYREGRELTKLNLGEVYFRATEEEGRKFLEEILQGRFKATKKGSLEQLQRVLGEHEHGKNFGEYIKQQARPGDARFYGFRLLCSLCSGDVSFVIELFRILVGERWDEPSLRIDPIDQDSLVKRFAHQQLADLQRCDECGPKLHDFAVRVGSVLKQYVLNSTPGGRVDERLRIEIEGSGELSEDAQAMHDALLRYSVIVNGGFGKSRSGLQTKRFYFRRMFAPCFPFSPARRGTIALTVQEYERWLREPSIIGNPKATPPDSDLFRAHG